MILSSMIKNLTYCAFFLCISLFSNAQPTVKNTEMLDQIIATVGKEILLHSDLEASKIQYISSGLPIQEDTECLLLEEALYQKLLVHQAAIDSIEVNEAQIQSEIDRRLRYFIDQIGSEQALENYYGKTITQIRDEYHDAVKDQLLSQNMQSSITSSIKVTPSEIKKFYQNINKDSLSNISAQVKIAQIVLKPEINSTEKDLVKEKLNGIRKRILAGEDFGTLAVLYSEDQGSAVKKGELGFMRREMLVPEFSAAAFKLRMGETSDIIESEFGFHIIQLVEKRGEQANFRHILLKPSISINDLSKAKTSLDSIKNLIDTKKLSFEQAAEEYSTDKLTKYNGGLIKHPNSGTHYFDVEELGQYDANLFFSIDKLEENTISSPLVFQDADGTKAYRIVKLLDRKDPHTINLKDDYAKLQEMALLDKQKRYISTWVNNTLNSTFIHINQKHSVCSFDNNWSIQP